MTIISTRKIPWEALKFWLKYVINLRKKGEKNSICDYTFKFDY